MNMAHAAWKKGAYWEIRMPESSFGYCRLLTFPYAEFLELNAREAIDDATVLDASRVLFAVAVHRACLRRWIAKSVQTRLPVTEELPIVFTQNVTNLDQCSIRGPDGMTREARPDECVGLERAAIWPAREVEARLWDALSGRTNARVESLRVKLPAAQVPTIRADNL